MKKFKLFLLISAIGLVSATRLSAQDFYVNSIGYKISSSDVTVVNGKNVKGDVILPDYVTYKGKEYRVTGVGESAFRANTNLTSIILPDDVTGIEENAFSSCKNLTSVILPEGLEYIRSSAFSGCKNLTSINFPEGLMSIAIYAFQNCSSLTSVTLPESLTTLAIAAFRNCEKLTSITIPKNVETIKESVFEGCTGLTSITISEGITSIESYAFKDCSNLTSITIPKSVTNMAFYAFSGCEGNEIILNCNIPEGKVTSGTSGICAFTGSSFRKYIINETVTEIGNYAFFNCEGEIVINSNQLSYYALGGFTSKFSKVTFGENVTSIPDQACLRNTNLTTVIIPESVTSIGDYAFNGCTNMTDLYCYAKIPPSTGENTFDESAYQNVKLHVPTKYQKLYQAVDPWNKFSNFVIDVTAITLSQSEATIAEGGRLTLTATIAPENATDKSIKWSSSDKTVAYVDSNGQISALNPGTAIITATARDAGGVSASCEVNVVPASYVVTYIIDDEVYATDTIVRDTPIEPIQPQKEGHTFSGWANIPEIMPAKDITVIGIFVPNDYLVTFKIGDEVISAEILEYGTQITVPEDPKKEGYTFNGWGEVPETMPAKDVTISGSFTINNYTITYVVDGEVYKTESIAYGSEVSAIASPVKEGYTFSGWSGVPSTMPAKDITINGSFTVNSYTVTYVVDGEQYKTESYTYGSAITAAEAPVKEGYTFSGWNEVPETMPAKDVTVNGSFTVNTYTVTYMVDGELYKTGSYTYGTVITALAEPIKEGYTFSGWSEIPATMPAKDVTVSGSFTVNSYTITYVVDGEVYKTESIAYGSEVAAIAAPVKEGHTFSGWSEMPETMPAKDVTVNGSFTVNSYTITYIVDGEVYKTESIAYGSKVEAIASPVKEGYTFSGWSGVPSTMPAKDVTVNGSFTVNTYTVTYMVDGELYKTESYAYGSVITAETPTKEGYTFSGWSEVPETMPAHDITIEGYYIVNSYNVVFIVDGEVIYSENLPYGSEIVAPEVPEKEGYTFNGWNELLATVPAHDVTFEGTYTVNVYKVYYYVGEELVHTAEVAYGDVIPEYVYEPTEGDYTFLGWEGDAYETMPAHDVYYIANTVTTGVEQLRNDNEALVIYDLTGRKVIDTENLKGGIYIVNGKKVLIK